LQDQFRHRLVKKSYLALVDGKPPTPTGRIEAPIGRDPRTRRKMAIVSEKKGRAAYSEYQTLEKFDRHTLLEVRPITGRTHQIRLHLAYLGCPVAGDTVYGLRQSSIPPARHFLHAGRLEICIFGESSARTFEAPLPDELSEVLAQLRRTPAA
jgi:23S rRNA pseudouridine1911/1915/1917 synthase